MRETRNPPVPSPPPVAQQKRTLLLVDDEEGILSALKRLLRREGYELLTALGGESGLELLAGHPVDVIVSDQRMPGMSGVEFLRRAKVLRPETIRIVLSGYTELQSITSAINEGAIFKFLTKPWDDDQLRAQIADAFHQKELADENLRLSAELERANRELAEANQQLRCLLREREGRINRNEIALGVLHEVMDIMPWPFFGIDDEGMIVTMNAKAEALFGAQGLLLGMSVEDALPAEVASLLAGEVAPAARIVVMGTPYLARCQPLSIASAGRGKAITLIPEADPHRR